VRRGEGGDLKIPQRQDRSGRKRAQQGLGNGRAAAKLPSGAPAGVNGQGEVLGQGIESGDMIGMLVGDEIPERSSASGQDPSVRAQCAAPDPGVHEQMVEPAERSVQLPENRWLKLSGTNASLLCMLFRGKL
jgi:hypothetical protein